MSKPATSDTPQQIGKLEKIRNLRYMYNNVEYDEDTNEYNLVQKKNTIESLEEPYNSELISYVFGVFESRGKTKKKGTKKKKSTTRKLTIEEDSPPEEKAQEAIDVTPSKLPVIGPDGTITWEDENYKKAWNYLSPKHKELLSRDAEWLQESMDAYAIKTKERNTLKFIYPKNIIFPPRKMEDGSFDFGNDFYNEVSNTYKDLISEYLKDLEKVGKPNLDASGKPNGRDPITKERADKWFKGRLEEKIYDYFYPVRSQLIVR
jgi:hypothetical protein